MREGEADVEVGVRLLLVRELDVEPDRLAAALLGAAVGRLHHTGAAPGHDREARFGEEPAGLDRGPIRRMLLAHARGAEDRDRGLGDACDGEEALEEAPFRANLLDLRRPAAPARCVDHLLARRPAVEEEAPPARILSFWHNTGRLRRRLVRRRLKVVVDGAVAAGRRQQRDRQRQEPRSPHRSLRSWACGPRQ